MKPAKPRASAALPQRLADALSSQGFRVYGNLNGQETLICEVFWARDIPVRDIPVGNAAAPSAGLFYNNLRQGTLLGVIHFLIIQRYVRDYRSQIFRPGYYTMRYSPMPEGPNGSALDFALLSPVGTDKNPELVPAFDQMVRRGRLSSRTRRPSMMSLSEIDNDQSFPSLITDEEGTSVLQVKLRTRSARLTSRDSSRELPLALTVITAIPEDLGD